MAGPNDPNGWAPLEPLPDRPQATPPPAPGEVAGSWGPPTTPPGWGPPAGPAGWAPPPSGGYGATAAGYGPRPQHKGGDARTGPLPLHPMSVGDVLDGAFKLLKANLRTILLVVAAVVVPLQLASAFLVRDQVSPGLLNIFRDPTIAQNQAAFNLGDLGSSMLTVLLGLLTAPLIAGAVSRVCAASYLGQQIGPGEALKSTLHRLPALLAASFLVLLLQVLGFVLCILPGIALSVLYTVVTPALMIEEIGPIQAMRRSWRLIRPRFWGVLGIVILAFVISSFVGNLLGGAPSAIGTIFGGSFAWLWIAVGSVLASLVSAPITAIVDTLLYFDGRIRNEGFDLEVMAQDLERSAVR
ncbi:MAG TPA: hypothetical protein VM143_05660 [Acidimicrobiales bacterium]|nr:hypothetical protein [Acidimicrobiales bacterium]